MEMPKSVPDTRMLLDLTTERMPYGLYKGYFLCDLPESYLVWMSRNGFPAGRLGEMLASLYEIKANGLDYLLSDIKQL
ncbi:MAG: DUF3820 family protein [Dehalococcoidia bacterium]|nr:DUF3820 family protein [Dehalococcoidia bacterium]